MSRRPHPLLLLALVVAVELGWSFNYIAGKIGLRYLDVLTLVSFRLVLAGLLVIPVYLLSPRPVRIERADLPTFARLGLFGVAINQGCFTVGLNYTTVGHSAIIVGSGPIFVLLLARLFRMESLNPAKVLGMAVSFTGVTILTAEHGLHFRSSTLTGDLITVCGSMGFALYTVLGKQVARKYDTVAVNTFNHLAGGLILLPLAVRQAARLDWAGVAWQGWVALAYMSLFASVTAYLVYYWALRYLPASGLAAFSYLLPIFSATLGVVLLGEKLTHAFLGGATLALAGVALTHWGRRAVEEEAQTAAPLP